MAKYVPQEEMSLLDQVQVRRDKLAALQAEGRDPFQITKFEFDTDSAAIKADYAAFEGKTVRVAGRLMSKRGMGKVLFCAPDEHKIMQLDPVTFQVEEYHKFDQPVHQYIKYHANEIVLLDSGIFKL